MDIAAISLVLDVARLKSFAAAARARGLDPSSVSRTVAQVENAHAVRLFQRSTRRLALTEAGEVFVSRMAPLVEDYARAVDELRSGRFEIDGSVRLTASTAFGQMRLIPLLARFSERFPALNLELLLDDATLDLVDNRIDLAIRLGPSVTGDLVCAKLRPTRYRVCASPAYIAAAGAVSEPSDLAAHEALLFALDDFRSRWLFRDRKGRIVEAPVHGRIVISSALGLRAAALDGLGPALLADWLIDDDLAAGRLVDLFPDHDATATTFDTAAWLVYPSRSYLPRRVRGVIDFLRDEEARYSRTRPIEDPP